jgi:peptidoglycan-N-acetylglucosamine deacetylase
MKRVIVIIVLLFIFSLSGIWLIRSRTFQLFGDIVHRVQTHQKVVALTFDDGPTHNTAEVLEILDRHGVKATFFLTGLHIGQHPELTRKIISRGHEVGNHSYSHRRMVFKSYSFIRQEIETTNDLIRQAGYQDPVHFRPPYGNKLIVLPWYLSQNNITTIMWNISPDVYPELASDTQAIIDHVVDNVKPGSIILLHTKYDGNRPSLLAVEGIIISLRQQGYRFVKVAEIMEYGV